MFDTCNCEKSEDCLCAALSSYVHACAANGVLLSGWRDSVCSECPPALEHVLHGLLPAWGSEAQSTQPAQPGTLRQGAGLLCTGVGCGDGSPSS